MLSRRKIKEQYYKVWNPVILSLNTFLIEQCENPFKKETTINKTHFPWKKIMKLIVFYLYFCIYRQENIASLKVYVTQKLGAKYQF